MPVRRPAGAGPGVGAGRRPWVTGAAGERVPFSGKMQP
jgi:hypothetical protein